MKIINALFWFMFGGVFTLLLVNRNVISANVGDLSTEADRAVYNLHDHLLDYVIFFIGATLMLLFIILALKLMTKYK